MAARYALAGAGFLGGCVATLGFVTQKQGGTEDVWRKEWSPARSYKYRSRGGFYDNAESGSISTWQSVLKSDSLHKWNFNDLDRDGDGFVDAKELVKAFGSNNNIEALIKEADHNGDGKIDYSEWLQLKLKLMENDKVAVESLPFAAKLLPAKTS